MLTTAFAGPVPGPQGETEMEKSTVQQPHEATGQSRLLVLTAALAAMACAATMVVRIPTPTGGYVNLGDAVVLLGAYLLGPGWGAAAAGIGSALADLLGGATPVYTGHIGN